MAVPTMTANSPFAGYITWAAFSIQYQGVSYSIPTGNTSKRWVWWRYNTGGASTIIEAEDNVPDGQLVNLLTNMDFELSDTTDPTLPKDWLRPGAGGMWYNAAHTTALSTAQILSGTQSVALTTGIAGSSGPNILQAVTLTPGVVYRVTFRAKASVTNTQFYAIMLNSTGTAEVGRFSGLQPTTVTTSWQTFTGTMVIPAGVTSGRLSLLSYSQQVGYVTYVDDVEFGMEPLPGLVDDDLVLFGNKNGVPFRVQSSSFVDGDLLIDGSVAVSALAADVIVTDEIYSQAGYFGKVKADAIEAGQGLITELEVTGGLKFNVTPTNLKGTMRLNAKDGLVIDHADPITGLANGKQTYIKADGTGSQFIGNATLNDVTVLGGLNLSGTNMGVSGTMRAQNGYTTPTSPVSVTGSYSVNTFHTSSWWDGTGGTRDKTTAYFNGLCDDPAGNSFIVGRYGTFGTPYSDVIWGSKTATDSYITGTLPPSWAPIGGITRIANTYYILCCGRDGATGVLRYDQWRVWKMDATTGAYGTAFDLSLVTVAGKTPTIGTDGTNLLIPLIAQSTDTLYLRVVAPTFTGTVTSSTPSAQILMGTVGQWTGTPPSGIIRTFANGPIGLDRYYISSQYGGGYAFTTTGTRMTAEYFALAAGNSRGMFIDPSTGALKTLHTDGRIYGYTWLNGTWDVGHTWYGTARAPDPAAETFAKVITVAPPRFTFWTVSLSESPPGTDANTLSPNAARIYAGPVGAPTLQDTFTGGQLTKTYSTPWPLTSPGVPGSNGFATRPGGLGVIESTKKDLLAVGTPPIWQFDGAGIWRLGFLSGDETGKSTTPTAGYRSTSTDQSLSNATFTAVIYGGTPDHQLGGITLTSGSTVITVPVAGVYVIHMHVNWVTNATGRRIIQLERWASAAAVPSLGLATNAIGRNEQSPNSYSTNDMTVQISLVAGDKLRLDAYQSSTATLGIDNAYGGSQFNIRRVG